MQTFLTSVDFDETARVLDNKRLNKQALEGWQIMMTLLELDPEGNHRTPKGWTNHPAVKMWRGHEGSLCTYVMAMVSEWKRRGFKSTIGHKAENTIQAAVRANKNFSWNVPAWYRNSTFSKVTTTHRQALLAKNYEWYSQFGWPEDSGTPTTEYEYYWPI